MKKINLKLILLHSLATILLAFAFMQLIFLFDVELVNKVNTEGFGQTIDEFGVARTSYFSIAVKMSPLIGILIGFIISLYITIRKKRGVINSIIVLVLTVLINKLGLLSIDAVNDIIFAPGRLIINSIIGALILNGTLYLLLGLWVQLSKQTNKFIVG